MAATLKDLPHRRCLHTFFEIGDRDLEDAARAGQADAVGKRRSGKTALIRVEGIDHAIVRLRGHNVMLDSDLAGLYRVDAKVLNQAVKRNRARFPTDFMFRLTVQEAESLRSQIVTLNGGRGRHRKYLPHAFTEQGVAMLSSVLRSARAVKVNIEIMRAFVRIRQMVQASTELGKKLEALERKYDGQFEVVFEAIRELMMPPAAPRKRIGFRPLKP